MAVRKTESTIPAGLTAPGDLGQVQTNPSATLVSFLSSPIVVGRVQNYVVFPAASIASTVATYRWTMDVAGTVTNETSSVGIVEYTPSRQGSLSVRVELMNAGGTAITNLQLQQNVVQLNTQLEQLIDQQEANVPRAAHPATSREALNDYRIYVDAIAPLATEPLLDKLILSIAYSAALQLPQLQRNNELESHAAIINNGNHPGFLQATQNGIGICKVRPQLLAMFLAKPAGGTYIAFAELPADRRQRQTAVTAIETAFNGLTEDEKTDLYNRLRFPKSNAAMCKLILEELKNRYFAGQTFQQLLSDQTKTRQLITHFESGPWVPAAIRLAGTSQTIFQLMNNPVWAVAAVGGSAAGAGGAPPPGGPIVVGDPEHRPEQTYVAVGVPPPSDSFIRMAFLYHDAQALNPETVNSFEDLINRLSQQTTHLNRIRIVSHFQLTPSAGPFPFMKIKFFTAAARPLDFTEWWHFRFGVSDEEGLRALTATKIVPVLSPGALTNRRDLPFNPAQPTLVESMWKVIIRGIRNSSQSSVLAPFGLVNAWPPAGDLSNLIRYCTDIFFLDNVDFQLTDDAQNPTITLDGTTPRNVPLINAVKGALRDHIQGQIDQLKLNVGRAPRTVAEVEALIAAITGMTLANLPVPQADLGSYAQPVGDPVYLANHDAFRQQLNTVRARLTTASFVDIRGCQVGQDARYMQALKEFFSTTTSRPTITAPDWFQAFSFLAPFWGITEQDVDRFFDRGFSSTHTPPQTGTTPPPVQTITYTGADIQREYSNWSGRIGINGHMAFWDQLFRGDVLEFLTIRWKANLPSLGMEAVRLAGFNALTYEQVITRLQEIFHIPATSAPTAAALQAFQTNVFPQVVALRDADIAISGMTAAATGPELQAKVAILTPIATALGQALAAAPNPLTLAYVQQARDQLKQFVITQSQINTFFQAVAQKLTDPKAGYRYLLFIGLPLCVQSAANENGIHLVVLQALRDDALKSWMKIHWAGPVTNAAAIQALNFNWTSGQMLDNHGTADVSDDTLFDLGRALQAAFLARDRGVEVAVNPMNEYRQHIVSV